MKTGGQNDLRSLRIPGVLQRFGLSYLLVAVPEAVLTPREYLNEAERSSLGFMLDITSAGWQWFLTFIIGKNLFDARNGREVIDYTKMVLFEV